MSTVVSQSRNSEAAAYGGMMDVIGGVATAVLAIVGLAKWDPELAAGVAIIVFGASMLIQGGTLLSEYSQILSPATGMGALQTTAEAFGGDGLAAMFPVGIAGIVLGILALLGVGSHALTPIAVIAFGAALILSAQSVRKLHALQSAAKRSGAQASSAREYLAGEMASGSGGIQFLAGVTAVVLGIIAVAGLRNIDLTLVALLVVGLTLILTGSALSGLVLSFMPSQESSSAADLR